MTKDEVIKSIDRVATWISKWTTNLCEHIPDVARGRKIDEAMSCVWHLEQIMNMTKSPTGQNVHSFPTPSKSL
jgi:hypothetical protein